MSNGFSIVWAWSICTSHTSIRFSRPRALCDARRKDFVFLFWWRISEVWDFCVCLHDSRSKTAMRKNRSTTVCHTTASHPHTIGSILQTDKYFSSVNRTYEIDRQICLLCVVWLLIHRLPEPTFLHSLSLSPSTTKIGIASFIGRANLPIMRMYAITSLHSKYAVSFDNLHMECSSIPSISVFVFFLLCFCFAWGTRAHTLFCHSSVSSRIIHHHNACTN